MKNTILLVIGAICGVLGNMYANKLSEDRIIKALTAQINELKDKKAQGRITAEQQAVMNCLEQTVSTIRKK